MLNVTPIAAFTDNYIWLLSDANEKFCAIIDPGDAKPVLDFLQQTQMQLTAILITHRHWDHVNGIAELLQYYPHIPVYGPKNETIPHRTHAVEEGKHIQLEEIGIELQVLDVAGHTAGHIAYYSATEKILFCGDTLFACGCGRIFDGTAAMLYQSLVKIAQLPTDTLIYCTHEYTLDNIGFAQWIEPENKALIQRLKDSQNQRDHHQATVPFTLALELATNPFLRLSMPTVINKIEQKAGKTISDEATRFAILRHWKDTEYD